MAHFEQQDFCVRVKNAFPNYFKGKRVLDVGSLDICGNNRHLFEGCGYVGLDLGAGKNVDIIGAGHTCDAPDGFFDVIVSTEAFEHDMYYEQTLKNIVRMLKPGGLFFFTVATTGRAEHGTRRSAPQGAPLLEGEWSDYYKNLTREDIKKAIYLDYFFTRYAFENPPTKLDDLYFWGIRRDVI